VETSWLDYTSAINRPIKSKSDSLTLESNQSVACDFNLHFRWTRTRRESTPRDQALAYMWDAIEKAARILRDAKPA